MGQYLHSFLRLNSVPLYVYTTFSLSTHLWMDTWVASIFYITFAIVSNVAMNVHIWLYSFIVSCVFLHILWVYSFALQKTLKQGFPGDSVIKNLCNAGAAGDMGSISWSGRSPGRGHGNPLQYSCLGNHGQRSLAGYSPWGCKELDMTEVTWHARKP